MQVVLAGLGDRVAKYTPDKDVPALVRRGLHAYQCDAVDEPVFIHPASSAAAVPPAPPAHAW